MRRDISYDATYPHPIERVWAALIDAEAMSEWLMPNDFEPVVGHEFTFRTEPAPGFDGIVHCRVLELDAPRRLAMTWRGGGIDTVLRLSLEPVGEQATRLTFEHTGFEGVRGALVGQILAKGTRRIYGERLPAYLDRLAGVQPGPTAAEMPRPGILDQVIARLAAILGR